MIWSKTFDICLQTQLGKRYGKMSVAVDGNSISGSLYVLNKCEKIRGEIDGKGNCHIYGRIVSLMRVMYFDGWGTITEHNILLSIVGKKSRYILYGKPEVNTANDITLADNK